MSIKKYTNGSWTPACRKYGTETDSITTLPVTIIGDGTPITSYTIKGNMEQNGTPTPSSPIYPTECGERTENLFDKDATDTSKGYIDNSAIIASGNIGQNNNFYVSEYIRVSPNTNYTWKWTQSISSATTISMTLYDDNKVLTRTISYEIYPVVSFLTSSNEVYARVTVQKSSKAISMFTAGSTAPTSYIPYGYKLPITLGSTTTDIYLGEVQSTRRIKKLVLTGEENWSLQTINSYGIANLYTTLTERYGSFYVGLSSHFNIQITLIADTATEGFYLSSGNLLYIRIDATSASTSSELKSYLATQYANGTPVTVWYVLAEPETAVVNEPLRKIGNYVDSVSGTNLATTGTLQGFDIETTLKPSEVDMTYHGWHEHDDTKYST